MYLKRWGRVRSKAGLVLALFLLAVLAVVSCGGGDGSVFFPPDAEPPVANKPVVPKAPIRITNAGAGTLAYTDYERGAVVFINTATLEEVGRFSVPGTPLGIAVVANTVFVGIPQRLENGRLKGGNVDAYNREGKYLYTLGSNSGYGLTKKPVDIEINETLGGTGRIFVLDASIKKVKDYSLANPKDETSYTFPSFGAFANATSIALDTVNNYVLVSDYGGFGKLDTAHGWDNNPAEIQVYDDWVYTPLDPKFINSTQPGYEFSTPQGGAVDSSGNFYVADILGGRVLIFNSAGQGIGTLGSPGTGPGELLSPLDVVLDEATGDVFVTNNRNGRIEVFRGAMP